MYAWECQYCGWTQKGENDESLKSAGKTHLERQHLDEVEDEFRRCYAKGCKNGCGFTFPSEYESHPGLTCPQCGQDHTSWQIGQLAYIMLKEV